MATEKRLIDANAFIDDIKTEIVELWLNGLKGTPQPRDNLYDIIDRIGEQPTVDAVEVVRCKDCRFTIDRENETHGCYRNFIEDCKPDDFCSYGERRTET